MKIKKAFKFRLKPTVGQAQQLDEFAGSTRFLWNKALDLNLQCLQQNQPILYYQELDFWSKLSHKKRFSSNWKKQRRKIA